MFFIPLQLVVYIVKTINLLLFVTVIFVFVRLNSSTRSLYVAHFSLRVRRRIFLHSWQRKHSFLYDESSSELKSNSERRGREWQGQQRRWHRTLTRKNYHQFKSRTKSLKFVKVSRKSWCCKVVREEKPAKHCIFNAPDSRILTLCNCKIIWDLESVIKKTILS